MAVKYDLLAIDLDGTLLGADRRVSRPNLEAVRAARDAGLRIAICTGRGLRECEAILKEIEQLEPVVVAGGSITACPVKRCTLNRFSLDEMLVRDAVERLLSHSHPVMVLKDSAEAGYDYLMVVGEQKLALDPVTVWWLEAMDVRHRFCCHLDEDEHPAHTVRLGVCGISSTIGEIERDLRETFGERAVMHHFGAVVAPEHMTHIPAGERLHILEVFDRQASKWSAIEWLAARDGIPGSRICAIGDEINDLPMIASAGLGVAMGNAIEPVKRAAKRETRSNDEDGVAHAIDMVLTGQW